MRWKRWLMAIGLLFLGVVVFNTCRIYRYAGEYHESPADVAIVLGAGTADNALSPVFRERVRHGINLHQRGIVRYLLFTGGRGTGQRVADSEIAARYAEAQGVPRELLLTDTVSTDTYSNTREAKRLMAAHQLANALVVSDDLHMQRAMAMCRVRGIDGLPSPTPTSMYRGGWVRFRLLLSESVYYHMGLFSGRYW
ncbi:MAG: YdcF family protein [Bacteroidota bacterium]